MMPVIRVNDGDFEDLKSIAAWYGTPTPSEAVRRIIRETMERLGMERDPEPTQAVASIASAGAIEFGSAPGLAFTKPLSASVNGKSIPNPRWSDILLATIGQVKAKGLEGSNLVHELQVRWARADQYNEEGFTYHPDLGISVQGQSASDAWKEIDRMANKWRIPVTVEFQWRQNPKAQYPGKTGVLRSGHP